MADSSAPAASGAPAELSAFSSANRVVMSDSDSDEAPVPSRAPAEVTQQTASSMSASQPPLRDAGSDSDDDDNPRARRQAAKLRKQQVAAAASKEQEAAAVQNALEEQQRWDEFEAFVQATSAAVLPDDDDMSTGTPDIEDGQWASLEKDTSGREEIADERSWAAPWQQYNNMSVAVPGGGGFFSVPVVAQQTPPQQAHTWGAAAPMAAFPAAAGAAAASGHFTPPQYSSAGSADPDVARRMQALVSAPAFDPTGAAGAAAPPKPRPKLKFNPNAAEFNPSG